MQPVEDLDSPIGALLGTLNASYNLCGVITLSIVPWVNEIIDRKHGIAVGSAILIMGVVLKACAQKYVPAVST